jgi:hypothetical protein
MCVCVLACLRIHQLVNTMRWYFSVPQISKTEVRFVRFSGVTACPGEIRTGMDYTIEHWSYDTDKLKLTRTEETLSQCHCEHTDFTIEP